MPASFQEYADAIEYMAKYPESGTGSLIAVNYCSLGLGEAGELQGKVKKVWRDDGAVITEEKRQEMIAELGDVMWYATRMAIELGSSLEEVTDYNVAKLKSRHDRGTWQGSGDNR